MTMTTITITDYTLILEWRDNRYMKTAEGVWYYMGASGVSRENLLEGDPRPVEFVTAGHLNKEVRDSLPNYFF